MIKIKMESFGIYLPKKIVTTKDILASCRHPPRWNFERVTGIQKRRVAVNEHSADLGIKAAKRALKMSRYKAEELDFIICTSISKQKKNKFQLEPATAMEIRTALGAENAKIFDITNACAGMWAGIWVLQGFLKSGLAKCGMIVSGEYNTVITETAIQEIKNSFDKQIASLTIGDAGAAVIFDISKEEHVGLHYLKLITGARYSNCCYAKPSALGNGIAMYTKAKKIHEAFLKNYPPYLKEALDSTGWSVDDINHVIPHQTAVRAIKKGIRIFEERYKIKSPLVTCIVVNRYGNTSTTSHFIALHDLLLQGQLKNHQNVVLLTGASGMVIGTATLTLDDLPTRYLANSGDIL